MGGGDTVKMMISNKQMHSRKRVGQHFTGLEHLVVQRLDDSNVNVYSYVVYELSFSLGFV